jgi:hypothetical protein
MVNAIMHGTDNGINCGTPRMILHRNCSKVAQSRQMNQIKKRPTFQKWNIEWFMGPICQGISVRAERDRTVVCSLWMRNQFLKLSKCIDLRARKYLWRRHNGCGDSSQVRAKESLSSWRRFHPSSLKSWQLCSHWQRWNHMEDGLPNC